MEKNQDRGRKSYKRELERGNKKRRERERGGGGGGEEGSVKLGVERSCVFFSFYVVVFFYK